MCSRKRTRTSCLPHFGDSVGTRDFTIREAQYQARTDPSRRFTDVLANGHARRGDNLVRYSFVVMDSHHLLSAGFAGAPRKIKRPRRGRGRRLARRCGCNRVGRNRSVNLMYALSGGARGDGDSRDVRSHEVWAVASFFEARLAERVERVHSTLQQGSAGCNDGAIPFRKIVFRMHANRKAVSRQCSSASKSTVGSNRACRW